MHFLRYNKTVTLKEISMEKNKLNNLKLMAISLLVGLVSGLVVGAFRWLIGLLQSYWLYSFRLVHGNYGYWILIILGLLLTGLIAGYLVKNEPHAGGSGIPEVELQLQGKLQLNWWNILWRKFIGGILAIGSGLFLGREGPSIQLGAAVGQGISNKCSKTNQRVLLAAGAASGLSAAFGAPLGGTMFVLEEVFHNFSPRVWLNSLTAALAANFLVSNLFGQRPVLAIPYNHSFSVDLYWHLLVLGVLLGIIGRIYQWGLLNGKKIYAKIPLPRWLHGLIPLGMLIPIAYFVPQVIGGGNQLILNWHGFTAIEILFLVFLLRISFSIISYDSGLPGGIFLPILTMGALLGALYGMIMVNLGLLPRVLIVNLVIFSMAGLFSAIVRSPFTAILLITEMVGSLLHLMPLAVLALVAYLVNDLLGGKPIYESLADQMEHSNIADYADNVDQLTVSIFENSKLADKEIKDIAWPSKTLVRLIHRGAHDIIPTGRTKLLAGDLVVLEIDSNARGRIYDQIKDMQK